MVEIIQIEAKQSEIFPSLGVEPAEHPVTRDRVGEPYCLIG